MSIDFGPYAFDRVLYDPSRDVLELWQSSDPSGGARDDEDTPEGHTWLWNEDESEIVGLQVLDVAEHLRIESTLVVTLPNGDRVESAAAAAHVRRALSRASVTAS